MSAHHQQLNPLSHPHHHQRYASVGGGPPLTMTITSPVISPTTTSGIGAQRQTTFAPTLPLNIPNILESSRKYYVPELRDSVEVIKQPRTIPSSTNGVQPTVTTPVNTERFVRHCMGLYTKDWTLISLRHGSLTQVGSNSPPLVSPMVSPVVSPRGVVVLTPEESALLASEMEKDVGTLKGRIAPSNAVETTALASTSNSNLNSSNPIFTAHSTSSLPTATSTVQTSNSSSSIASSASAPTIPNKAAPPTLIGDSSTSTAIPDPTQVPPTPLITTPTLKEDPEKIETEVMTRTNVEHVAELRAVLEGKNKSFYLKKGQQYIIGRTSDCQIALEAKHMSKHHARLDVDEQGACFLVDLGSTNKTKVLIQARKGEVEKVLEPHTPNRLTHHCTLTFADVQAQFLLVPTLEKEVRKHKKRGSTTKDKEKEKEKEKDKEKEKEKRKDNRRSTSLNDLRNTKRDVRKSKRSASANEFSLDVDILQPTGNKRPPIHSNTLPIYKTAPSSDKSIGRVTTVDAAFPEKPSLLLVVGWKEFRFTYGPVKPEPFFTTLTLFDANKKDRITESFSFYLAPPFSSSSASKPRLEKSHSSGSAGGSVVAARRELTKNHSGNLEDTKSVSQPANRQLLRQGSGSGISVSPKSARTACVFSIDGEANLQGLYLVLRVGKVLKAEPEKELNSFFKPPSKESKDQGMKEDFVGSGLKYFHVFAWSAASLADLQDTADISFPLFVTPPSFSDETVHQLLSNEKEFKRQKLIPGECLVSVRRGTEVDKPKIGMTIQSFTPKPIAMLSYINLLYLLLDTVQFTVKVPNVMIQIKLKEDDADPEGEGLLAFYARGSQEPKDKRALSSVSCQEKHACFTDDIKLQLPLLLTPNHHLLVSFYSVKTSANKRDDSLTLIGYSIIPLFINGKIIKVGSHKLAITEKLPPSYLSREAFNTVKYLDTLKAFFTFRVKVVSSIYPQDENINNFFLNYNSENVEGSMVAIRALRNATPSSASNFFPVIFNELFQIICSYPEGPGREAFIDLLHLVHNIGNAQLLSYVTFLFENPADTPKPLYEQIIHYWLLVLSEEITQKLHPIVESFPSSLNWWLFDLIVKSMVLKIHKTGELADSSTRRTRFKDGQFFVKLPQLLIKLLHPNRMTSLENSINLATFLKDLLAFVDPAVIYSLINLCMNEFGRNKEVRLGSMLRLTFLRVVLYHPEYLPLNEHPTPEPISIFTDLNEEYWNQHFLVALLINEINEVMKGESSRRQQAIDTLRDILRKHSFDTRYKDPEQQASIFNMYFPFVHTVVENYTLLRPVLDSQSGYSWLVCFLHIIKDCKREVLTNWWNKIPQNHHLSFLNILDYILKLFQTGDTSVVARFVVLEVVDCFIRDFNTEMTQEGNLLINPVFVLLAKLMQSDQEEFLICMYPTLQYVVHIFSSNIFRYAHSPFCEVLSFNTLRHCNFESKTLRKKACAFFYLLIKKNLAEMKNFSKMKLLSTVAISKLMGITGPQDFSLMTKSLLAIAQFANGDPTNSTSISAQVAELTNRLKSISQNSTKISQNSHDPEMLADIYYALMSSNITSPDMRVAWLETLSLFHEQNGSWEEAAQCKIFIASLIAQYLRRCSNQIDFFEKLDNIDLSKVSPNILNENEITEENITESGDAFQSDIWTLSGFIELLEEAAEMFETAESLESCIEVYDMLSTIQKKDKNYTAMIRCYEKLSELTKHLVDMEKKRDRVWPSYYRVAFYGVKLEDLNGNEFIYKEKSGTTLGNITQRIKKQLSEKFPGIEVTSLSNLTEVDPSTFNSEQLYTQIASVQAYPGEDRVTQFEENFNINRFIFEMGITADGKSHSEDMAQQQKKKVIFHTTSSFPHVRKRLPVSSKTMIILSPIENAIELIRSRNKALREVLETTPPNKTKLQQILSGSVTPMVNAGPVALCTSFLSKDQVYKHPVEQVEILRKDLDYFILLCAFAIKLHKSLVGSEQQELHQQYEQRYAELKTTIRQYTSAIHSANPAIANRSDLDRKVRNSSIRATDRRRITVLSPPNPGISSASSSSTSSASSSVSAPSSTAPSTVIPAVVTSPPTTTATLAPPVTTSSSGTSITPSSSASTSSLLVAPADVTRPRTRPLQPLVPVVGSGGGGVGGSQPESSQPSSSSSSTSSQPPSHPPPLPPPAAAVAAAVAAAAAAVANTTTAAHVATSGSLSNR